MRDPRGAGGFVPHARCAEWYVCSTCLPGQRVGACRMCSLCLSKSEHAALVWDKTYVRRQLRRRVQDYEKCALPTATRRRRRRRRCQRRRGDADADASAVALAPSPNADATSPPGLELVAVITMPPTARMTTAVLMPLAKGECWPLPTGACSALEYGSAVCLGGAPARSRAVLGSIARRGRISVPRGSPSTCAIV